MGLGPLPEQDVPPAVCVGLDFLEFPVLGKRPTFVHRGETLRVGQILVVVDELVTQSPQNVLEVPLVDEQRYRVRLGVVVPGADERVEQVDLFIVHLDIWGWVDLHAVLAVEFENFLYVVIEAHLKYLQNFRKSAGYPVGSEHRRYCTEAHTRLVIRSPGLFGQFAHLSIPSTQPLSSSTGVSNGYRPSSIVISIFVCMLFSLPEFTHDFI